MVTAEAVWEALGEVEDPEIPVISVVDLGVVRDVTVEEDRVHVEFTPTFLGCPALEVMRAQMAERIRELGAEPDVEVDPRRLVVDRPDHRGGTGEAPAGRLRAAGAARGLRPEARPTAERRLSLSLLRLERYPPGQYFRPYSLPLAPPLRKLPPAIRAVQDDLKVPRTGNRLFPCE